MMNRSVLSALTLFSLAACIACSQKIQAGTWSDIRDGVVYIRVTHTVPPEQRRVSLHWQDAWISEAQTDHIYILNPDGTLLRKLELTVSNTPGSMDIDLPQSGDYQIHVTGASFRNITVSTDQRVPTVFSPVKVHKAISVPYRGKAFFKVPKNTRVTFAARHHGGPDRFFLKPVNRLDQAPLVLPLKKHNIYGRFDSLVIPASTHDRIWQVTWKGSGKASFWLDNTENVFATQPQHLFSPAWQKGTADFSISDTITGTTPAIGVALPFTMPPKSSYPLLQKWNVKAANHYTFSDALSKKPEHDLPFLELYEKIFGIKQSTMILARSGRRPVINDLEKTQHFLTTYLKTRHSRGLLDHTYLAIADEPNLNYPDFERFEEDFATLAKAIKQHPDPAINTTRLAVPQSSRFINGPTRSGAADRKGIDWADTLIEKYGQWIDAISWHEWMVRDLVDTSRYRDAVVSATELAASHQQHLQKEPELIIGQTNISSGNSLSPYEQQTDFAALWWTSVVIQSSQPGKLDQLVWFKAADDPDYPKGLASVTKEGISEKPVSTAMSFINEHLGQWVLESEGSHPEVDLLATLSEDKAYLMLLGVNKSQRQQDLILRLALELEDASLLMLGKIKPEPVVPAPQDNTVRLTLPPKTIFALRGQLTSK